MLADLDQVVYLRRVELDGGELDVPHGALLIFQ
jgi:hypothetical protein